MKPSEVAKNMQAAIDLLTKQREEYLAAHPEATEKPQADEWPKMNDEYWFLYPDGEPDTSSWDADNYDMDAMAIGNCFRTKAEAIRHREALKVQAELRRMPGRCDFKPNEHNFGVMVDGKSFWIGRCSSTSYSTLSIAGVWFESKEAAQHALDTIGEERLGVWLDDYLGKPITEGGAV